MSLEIAVGAAPNGDAVKHTRSSEAAKGRPVVQRNSVDTTKQRVIWWVKCNFLMAECML